MTFTRIAAFLRPKLFLGLLGSLVLWACWTVSIAWGGGTFDNLGHLISADHLAFYTASQRVLLGQGSEIYDLASTSRYQEELFHGRWKALEAFRNPPFYALLYAPTARLPFAVSVWTWHAVSVGCLWLGLRWLRPARIGRAALWAFTFYPLFCVFSYGQNSLLSFAVFSGTYRLMADGRMFRAGAAAGLLWFKPQLLLGLFVLWAFLGRRALRCWAGVVATGAALTVGTYPFIPEAWAAFVQSLRDNVGFANFDQWKMHNPIAFARLLLPKVRYVPELFALVCLSAAVSVFAKLWARRRNDLPILYAAAIFLTLWANPHTLIYEWVSVIVTAVLLWEHAPRLRPAWVVLFVVVWATLFSSTHVSDWQEQLWKWGLDHERTDRMGPIFQISVPVLAWVGWRAVRQLRAEEDPAARETPRTARSGPTHC